MTPDELDGALKNEAGQALRPLGWWGAADGALADPAAVVVALHLMRQAGKTTYLARKAVQTMVMEPGSYIVFVTASETQAQSVFHRKLRRPVERMLKALGVAAREVIITKRSLELKEMGSKVEVIATSEFTSPGRSVRLLILDEARDIPDSVFGALAPSIIASEGKILVASTAGRPRGFFHQLVTDPGEDCRVVTAAANDNPYADQAKISTLARLLTKISPAFAARELHNEFTEDDVAMLLPAALIAAAVDDDLGELPGHDGRAYAFLDLSRKKDLTSLVVVVREPARRAEAPDHLVTASVVTWDPKTSPTKEVDFAEVRAALGRLPERFPHLERLLVDEGSEAGSVLPFARSLPGLALRVEGYTATVEKNMALWGALAARLHAQTLSIPRHARLLDELHNVRVEEFALGGKWRVVDSSKRLHRDVSLALAGAVYAAGEAGPSPAGVMVERQAAATPSDAARGFFGRPMPQFASQAAESDEQKWQRTMSELHGGWSGRGRTNFFPRGERP